MWLVGSGAGAPDSVLERGRRRGDRLDEFDDVVGERRLKLRAGQASLQRFALLLTHIALSVHETLLGKLSSEGLAYQ